MGVDYCGVGGIGVELDSDIIDKAIELELFTEEQWVDDEDECLEELGLIYEKTGNTFGEDTSWYLLVKGKTLGDIKKNSEAFVVELAKLGKIITIDDLKVISEYKAW